MRGGHGFAWIAEDRIREDLDSGALKPVPTDRDPVRHISLYLIHADPDGAGPGILRLIDLLKTVVAKSCARNPEASDEPA